MDVWINCTGIEPLQLGDKPIVIGRSPECDFQLPHQSVSRKHAVLGVIAGELTIQSKNPLAIRVNGQVPEEGRRVKLKLGDEVLIGPFVLQLSNQPLGDLAEATVPISLTVLQDKEIERELAAAEEQKRLLQEEIKASRKELESEVWRGLSTHREMAAMQRELEELKARTQELAERHSSHQARVDLTGATRAIPRPPETPRPPRSTPPPRGGRPQRRPPAAGAAPPRRRPPRRRPGPGARRPGPSRHPGRPRRPRPRP